MLHGEHSAILLTFIKLPFVIKTFVLSIFEWLLKTGFTVQYVKRCNFVFRFSMFGSPGPEVINFFPCSTQLSTKFILLINVKMPTSVGILTFISI